MVESASLYFYGVIIFTRDRGIEDMAQQKRVFKVDTCFSSMCRLNSNKFQKYTTVNYNDVVSKLTELPVSDNDLVLETLSRFAILQSSK